MPMVSQSNETPATSENEKQGRDRSTIEFTYNGLDDSEEIVNAIRSVGGTGCSLVALAAKLNLSATGGGFRVRTYSARTFGLCDITRNQIDLTDLGLRLIDSSFAKQARVDAFLNVDLYGKMYEQLKGQPLPPMAAIERMMQNAGVAPKQKDRARQVFIRSAKYAGFFDIHADRLVKPEAGNSQPANQKQSESGSSAAEKSGVPAPAPRVIYGGGGGGGDDIHPAILGLLRDLPAAGTILSSKRKNQLKAAFASTIDFIYPDPEDEP